MIATITYKTSDGRQDMITLMDVKVQDHEIVGVDFAGWRPMAISLDDVTEIKEVR